MRHQSEKFTHTVDANQFRDPLLDKAERVIDHPKCNGSINPLLQSSGKTVEEAESFSESEGVEDTKEIKTSK